MLARPQSLTKMSSLRCQQYGNWNVALWKDGYPTTDLLKQGGHSAWFFSVLNCLLFSWPWCAAAKIAGFLPYCSRFIELNLTTTRMGFEPTRAEHNGLAVHRLNHSATSSCFHDFSSKRTSQVKIQSVYVGPRKEWHGTARPLLYRGISSNGRALA